MIRGCIEAGLSVLKNGELDSTAVTGMKYCCRNEADRQRKKRKLTGSSCEEQDPFYPSVSSSPVQAELNRKEAGKSGMSMVTL